MYTLKKYRNIIIAIIFIVFFFIIFSSMHITLFSDEAFTLGLIKNNYYNLIQIDSLDVHPPLYYLLLKMFLFVTTFWSNNFIIKIIIARCFSLIISLLNFIVLHKILGQLKLQNNLILEIIIFMSLGFIPFYLVPISNFLIIRMYPLAALFVSLQFLEIIKFDKTCENKYLFCILLFTLGSFYTHYIAAIISGSLLLILFFKYLLVKNKNSFKILLISIMSILFYIPWIIIAFRQAISLTKGNWWMDYKYFFINIIFILLLILLFCIPMFLYKNVMLNNTKNEIIYLNVSVFIFLIIVLLISCIGNPMFQAKYMYPILLLYIFISLNIIIKNKKEFNILSIIIIFLLLLGNMYSTAHQILRYDLFDIKTIKEVNVIKYMNKVKISNHNNDVSSQAKYYTIILYCNYSNKFVMNYKELLNPNPNKKLSNTNYYLYKNVLFGENKYK